MVLGRLLDLLLPPRCGGCGSPGEWFCRLCWSRLQRPREPLCRKCGRELAFAGDGCGCRRRLRAISSVRSACRYQGPVELAIHRFKYEGWRALAAPLAGLMADRLAIDPPAGTLVVAVPLHPARRRSRGYNQSELLASEIRRRFGLDRPAGSLVRTRNTPPQVGLDRLRRADNVRGCFAWTGPGLAGAPVLLIDDVATTGATLDSCAAALREGGSGTVHALTVARVSV